MSGSRSRIRQVESLQTVKQSQEENKSIKTDREITDMMKSADAGIKTAIINILNMLRYLNENMNIMRKEI